MGLSCTQPTLYVQALHFVRGTVNMVNIIASTKKSGADRVAVEVMYGRAENTKSKANHSAINVYTNTEAGRACMPCMREEVLGYSTREVLRTHMQPESEL